ncbi:kinesin-like protein KIF26A isoform X2 [Chiloscyllium plagiosum]|uniref:kinesin-like protein KIF26A isoform X2 n=1 Tax=Chiloscyllium plagiosum TaxID=36176 RepID=UPI001CB82967|nr:kinesin-like protein KIF26A isoform X2 [Chiloscyllium plagiosum]
MMPGSKPRGLEPEGRRQAVLDGSPAKEITIPLQAGLRKRLQAAEEDHCGSRPAPEGAGAVSGTEADTFEKEEKGAWCQNCQLKLTELKRQAMKLVIPGSGKDPGFSAFIFDKLQVPDSSKRGQNEGESRCEICATHLNQLRKEAIQMVHALGQSSQEIPELSQSSIAVSGVSSRIASQNMVTLSSQRDWPLVTVQGNRQPGKSGNAISSTERRKGLGWPQAGSLSKSSVQVTVGSTGLSNALNSVTIQAQQYLEGMWSISRVNNFLPNAYLAPTTMTECGKESLSQETSIPPNSSSQTWAMGPAASQNSLLPNRISSGTSAAASFFIRAAQKLNLSSKQKKNHPLLQHSHELSNSRTNFSGILQVSPPPAPPCLLRAVCKVKDNPGIGKVKVMVRICPSQGANDTSESMSFLKVDSRKKQITLYDPSVSGHSGSAHRRAPAVAAPKMFAFDAVFTQDASQAEVCSGTVAEVIQSVVNGADGCIFCFGHVKLGKTYTMIGKDNSMQNLGVIPCAISWLFKLINERKEKTGTRFSVRVSAVEIWGKDENLRDLLSEVATGSLQDGQSPGVYLREDPICGTQLQNQSELRAPTAEKAAYFLDAAIASRRTSRPDCDEEERRNSHMLFTLHIYQYRMEKSGKGGMSGGRSRLHLVDLGSCEKVLSKSRDAGGGLCLSLSALGNVILALVNGAKHVPYKDSKLTMLLRESLGNINCRTTMITHISDSPANYAETLTSIQLAARIHRMRKKKSKYASSSSGGESSCEEGRIRRPPNLRPFHSRTTALDSNLPVLGIPSDPDYSSSSEQSCDTVIYVGPNGAALSDRELTDNEGPPEFVPIIPSLNKKHDPKKSKETMIVGKRTERDYFKCNTFAELQERLECIDGSEEPIQFSCEQGLFICSNNPTPMRMENVQCLISHETAQSGPATEKVPVPSHNLYGKHSPIEVVSPKKGQSLHAPLPVQQHNGSPVKSPSHSITTEHSKVQTKAEGSIMELSGNTGMDGVKETITASTKVPKSNSPKAHKPAHTTPAPAVREKLFFNRRPLPSPAPPPPQTKDRKIDCSESSSGGVIRTPPVGMSHQVTNKSDSIVTGGAAAHCKSKYKQSTGSDANCIRSAFRNDCIDRDMLTTTVTLQQPVELNGEDELVFTVVEELSFEGILESGRPASIISFNSDCSLQALASGSRPVSIISSINDDFEAYTSPATTAGANMDNVVPVADDSFCNSSRRSSISSWLSELSICAIESDGAQPSDTFIVQSCYSYGENTLGSFNLDSSDMLQDMCAPLMQAQNSNLTDSFFRVTEANKSTGSIKPVVNTDKGSSALGLSKVVSGKVVIGSNDSSATKTSTPVHRHVPVISEDPICYSSLPRKMKSTSSVNHSGSTVDCGDTLQQEIESEDPWLQRTSGHSEPKAEDQALSVKFAPKSASHSQIKQQMKTSHNTGTIPRLNKSHTPASCTQRVVYGCEMVNKSDGFNNAIGANTRKNDAPAKVSQVKKGNAMVATMPIMHTSVNTGAIPKDQPDFASVTSSLKSASCKKTSVPKTSLLPRLNGIPPAPPVRKSSLEQRNRVTPQTNAQKCTSPEVVNVSPSKLEDEIDGRLNVASCIVEGNNSRSTNIKSDHMFVKNISSSKSRMPKPESVHRCGSLQSLERCDSLTSVGSKHSMSKESGHLVNNSRAGRSVPRLGVSPSAPVMSTPTVPVVPATGKSNQTKSTSTNKVMVSGNKCRSLSTSGVKGLSTSVKSLTQSMGRSSSVPSNGKTIPRSTQVAMCKPGKGTIMGTKQAVRAANSRVSELASGASSSKVGHLRGSTDSDSGNDSGVNLSDEISQIPVLPSPYSKITAPRRPQRYSSGHGSDNSSVLSGELPPAMGRTALFYHSGGSSGYESMIRDSEATGSASSAHDSMSESGMSSSGRNRSSKSPKKRMAGTQRRRLIPAPLPDTSSLGRKPVGTTGQWVDLPPLPGTLKESFEIKVYEIDDVERLQRHRQEENEEPFQDVDKGLLYFNTKLKILEKRQQRIRELKAKHELLMKELEDTKSRLMMNPDKWKSEFEVDLTLDKESLEYLEALEEVTEELEHRVNLCKARIMMVTCFDIGMITEVIDGPREVQV